MSKEDEIPKSRKAYLFKMATKIAIKQGKQFLKNNPNTKLQTLINQADVVVSHVGRLKGAAMKAVQTLTVEGADFFPPEVLKVLEKLQSQAPTYSNDTLMVLLEKELGPEKFVLLKNISKEPIASASIGQVYSAQYNEHSVVVKIQYPDVAESVDADIDTLKKMLKAFLFLSQKKIEFEDIMEEARRVLKLETNYEYEKDSILKYKQLFIGSEYIIPDVFAELTTKKVIVLSQIDGLEFPKWLETNPSDEKKQKVADQLLMLYVKEFFENQLVQTDPNPANFLVNEKGQLALLDFGATMEFDIRFVEEYQNLLRSAFANNQEELLKNLIKMNFLSHKEKPETQKAFIDFLMYSLLPFEISEQPFDFSGSDYSSEVRKKALSFSRKLEYSAPPKQLIFLHRKLGGIFMLLKRLNVKVDLTHFRNIIINKNFY